jgi:S-adenosylmethionine hydrolase
VEETLKATDKPILVFQTDFTYAEGAVSSMYGVVKSVDRELEIFDGTHQIPQYDTWSASYRLYQSMPFWPKGTIYVSVVDPGVGTGRRACVARTADGHVVVTPDNGSLTHVYNNIGIVEVREIDESVNRLPSTRGTSVFAGRDVFGYTAARLASGIIDWEQVGPAYAVEEIVRHAIPEPRVTDGRVQGIVEICDPNFGNAWTTIKWDLLTSAGLGFGDVARVRIANGEEAVFDQCVRIERSFGHVGVGEPVVYCNEVMNVAFALCQGSLCDAYGIGFGPNWHVTLTHPVL